LIRCTAGLGGATKGLEEKRGKRKKERRRRLALNIFRGGGRKKGRGDVSIVAYFKAKRKPTRGGRGTFDFLPNLPRSERDFSERRKRGKGGRKNETHYERGGEKGNFVTPSVTEWKA